MNAVSLAIQVVFMQRIVEVQRSSLRPTQLPLMCVELATSPSGVSMVMWSGMGYWISDNSQPPPIYMQMYSMHM